MKEKRQTLGIASLIIGFLATLILPALIYIQSKTHAAQQQPTADLSQVYYWQGMRNIALRYLLSSIAISFVAGWLAVFAFRGWRKLFGATLILLSLTILFLSIPAT
ncbi:MAG: hypothetical protein U0487_02750 [Patescibacteria group bacterium]